jgi:GDP-L-fucose synthase
MPGLGKSWVSQRFVSNSGKSPAINRFRDAVFPLQPALFPELFPAVQPNDPIFVAGHRGLAGGAIYREFVAAGYSNLLTRSRSELDLTQRDAVRAFFAETRPRGVILAAAKVGGIKANNDFPVEFLLENMKIQNNIIEAAADHGTERLLFLGSSCIYPKFAKQPIAETELLGGYLEPTNEAYAIAKIAGIKLCQAYFRQYGKRFVSAMPTNLYGPGDNFDLLSSHVLPALLRKVHEAKVAGAAEVVVWGTGTPLREFLHVHDLAAACRFVFEHYNDENLINIGYGEDVTIRELAETICRVVGFEGSLTFDTTKPDGTPKKLMDSSRLRALGWRPAISLEAGIRSTYAWFLENLETGTVKV